MNAAQALNKGEVADDSREPLEKYYRIIGNGKLQMREDTPAKSEKFRENLRKLMDAKLVSRNSK